MLNLMFKYRLYPSRKQKDLLEHQLELCRQVYNELLLHCRETYKESKRLPRQFDLNHLVKDFKTQRRELKQVHSQVLQNISKRIKDGYTNFYARRRLGMKAGLPRFKKYGRYKSITYPQSGFKVERGKLSLSKIGNIRIKLHRPISGKVKVLTIKHMSTGKWFACFSCEVDIQPTEKPFKDVGIDVGLNSFAVLSDGTRIENPKNHRKEERHLKKLHRNLSSKKKGSNNRRKAKNKLARLYEKIQSRRIDFLHKLSRQIVDQFEIVYVEDLQIVNMMKNHNLAKSIHDASWGRFVEMLCYKAEGAGGRVIFVNPKNTTQNCSRCEEQVKKTLSDRTHECSHCGLVMDRDRNAALNILRRGREIGREPSESMLVEDLTTMQFFKTVQVNPMNQETSYI